MSGWGERGFACVFYYYHRNPHTLQPYTHKHIIMRVPRTAYIHSVWVYTYIMWVGYCFTNSVLSRATTTCGDHHDCGYCVSKRRVYAINIYIIMIQIPRLQSAHRQNNIIPRAHGTHYMRRG